MSICIIYNPHAGRERARRRLARLVRHWRRIAVVKPTRFSGQAEALAEAACAGPFSIVAAAGGDGTAHHVMNGLMKSGRADVTGAVIPLGSANDYAWTITRQFGPGRLDTNPGVAVDAGLVEAAGGRRRYFVESLGLGLSGAVTLEAGRIQALRGVLLYGLAAWRALARHPKVPLEIAWDGAVPAVSQTLLFSVLIGCREGNFLLAPDARLDDGWFDYVHARDVSRWQAIRMLPGLAVSGPPRRHPQISLGRCQQVTIRSPVPLVVHTDGEVFCSPEDGLREIAVRLLPSALRVKVCLPD